MSSSIRVGSWVKRRFENRDGLSTWELGMVIHIWPDPDTGDQDAYIAFFGDQLPVGKPQRKPYVLRYYVAGLELAQ